MGWQDFFSAFVIAGIVGIVFLCVIVCLVCVVCSLYKQIDRMETAINLLKHDKRMESWNKGNAPKDRETVKYERQQTLNAARLKRMQHSRRNQNVDMDEDYEENDEETGANGRYNPSGQDNGNDDFTYNDLETGRRDRGFQRLNPMNSLNRRNEMYTSYNSSKPRQIYRQHTNKYAPGKGIFESSKLSQNRITASTRNIADDRDNSVHDEADEPIATNTATASDTSAGDSQNKSTELRLDDLNPLNGEEKANESDPVLKVTASPSNSVPRPIRMSTIHYRVPGDADDGDDDDNSFDPRTTMMKGMSYFQSFLPQNEYHDITVYLKSLSLWQLQIEIKGLIAANSKYRQQIKLPERIVSSRIQDALDFKVEKSEGNANPDDKASLSALLLLRKYGQLLSAENEKFSRRIKSSRNIDAVM